MSQYNESVGASVFAICREIQYGSEISTDIVQKLAPWLDRNKISASLSFLNKRGDLTFIRKEGRINIYTQTEELYNDEGRGSMVTRNRASSNKPSCMIVHTHVKSSVQGTGEITEEVRDRIISELLDAAEEIEAREDNKAKEIIRRAYYRLQGRKVPSGIYRKQREEK